jgi:hypothetical protein
VVKVLLPLDDDLGSRIDAARGSVPRTRWIRQAIEGTLELLAEGSTDKLPEPDDRLPGAVAEDPSTTERIKAELAKDRGPVVPMPPAVKEVVRSSLRTYRFSPKECTHNFRQQSGFCPMCGDQR